MKNKQINLLFSMQEYAKHKFIELLKKDDLDGQFNLFNELDIIERVLK